MAFCCIWNTFRMTWMGTHRTKCRNNLWLSHYDEVEIKKWFLRRFASTQSGVLKLETMKLHQMYEWELNFTRTPFLSQNARIFGMAPFKHLFELTKKACSHWIVRYNVWFISQSTSIRSQIKELLLQVYTLISTAQNNQTKFSFISDDDDCFEL